tara:strand:+ start:145 stop:1458 length:1314 start_codon:yes stop_codon:yes gene_type:complete
MPPLGTTKDSRLRFVDLDPLLAELRQEGTAFMPEAVRVLRSGLGFLDEPFVESVHFARFGCPQMFDNGIDNFGTNVSRATVNFEVQPETPNCAHPIPEDGLTMLNTNQNCGLLMLPGELVTGFEYEPRCMVIVLTTDNEKQLFDEMAAAGRDLSEPIRVSVNYSVATGTTPDVKLATTSCHNGHVLLRNYELDRTGQDQLDELETIRNSLEVYTQLIEFTKHVRDSQALVSIDPLTGKATLLADSPPPPLPPPPAPDGSPAPPAPPETVSLDRQVELFEAEKEELEERELLLVETLTSCVVGDRAEETVCGLNSNEVTTLAVVFLLLGLTSLFLDRRHRTHGWRSTTSAAVGTALGRRERRISAVTGAAVDSNSCPRRSRPDFFLCTQGFGRQPLGRRHRPPPRAPRGRAVLHRRVGRGGLLLSQRDADAAVRRLRH